MPSRFYEYSLTLAAPLLVSAVEGDPNSVRTSLSIPGSAIRGAMARALTPSHPRFEELVLSGAVRFLNAYPGYLVDGQPPARSLPLPRSWRTDKYDERQTVDFSAVLDSGDDDERQYESPRALFVSPTAEPIGLSPVVRRHFHHARDPIKGRPTATAGAVFTYEAIEGGCEYCGMVAVSGDDGQVADRIAALKKASAGLLRFGRSKLTQYGGEAKLAWTGDGAAREASFAGPAIAEIDEGTLFRVRLTSDAIVRDERTGQIDPGAIVALFERLLSARVLGRFSGTVIVGGFNSKWRLALPQAPAVAAGSVFVLKATARVPKAAIENVEQDGIGERRAEGFGCVMVLPWTREAKVPLRIQDSTRPRPKPQPQGPLPSQLQGVQRRLYEAGIDGAIERHVVSLIPEEAPAFGSRALLGRLRASIRRGGGPTADQLSGFRQLLATLATRASRHLEDYPFDGTSLRSWLETASGTGENARDKLADRLFAGTPLDQFAFRVPVDGNERRRQVAIAQPRLIDAVLSLLAKRAYRTEGA